MNSERVEIIENLKLILSWHEFKTKKTVNKKKSAMHKRYAEQVKKAIKELRG